MRNLSKTITAAFTLGMLAWASGAGALTPDAEEPVETTEAGAHENTPDATNEEPAPDAHDEAPGDAEHDHAHEGGDAHGHDAATGGDEHAGHDDAHEGGDAHGHDAATGGDEHAGHGDTHEGGDAHGAPHGHGGGDHGLPWTTAESGSTILQHLFNLAVLLAILFFFGRRAIGDALRQRSLGIRTDLTEAARERDEARQRHADVEARLNRFETELDGMRAEAAASAEEDEAKLIQRAQEAANRITETAERNIRDEVVRAQVALRTEAVELAVKLAEDTLRGTIKGDDHRRLARQFLESLDD